MLLLQPLSQLVLPPAIIWLSVLSSAPPQAAPSSPVQRMDILEVIKVYGRLAGPTCYGKMAPTGASCQITRDELLRTKLGLLNSDDKTVNTLTRDEFEAKLQQLDFCWPLKPYGVAGSDSYLAKTALMNKGAETRLYMEELQAAGLYNPRDPTGPLPTSLRPALNARLQQTGVRPEIVTGIFRAFLTTGASSSSSSSSATTTLTEADWNRIFGNNNDSSANADAALDYYEFIQLLGGANAVEWR